MEGNQDQRHPPHSKRSDTDGNNKPLQKAEKARNSSDRAEGADVDENSSNSDRKDELENFNGNITSKKNK